MSQKYYRTSNILQKFKSTNHIYKKNNSNKKYLQYQKAKLRKDNVNSDSFDDHISNLAQIQLKTHLSQSRTNDRKLVQYF